MQDSKWKVMILKRVNQNSMRKLFLYERIENDDPIIPAIGKVIYRIIFNIFFPKSTLFKIPKKV